MPDSELLLETLVWAVKRMRDMQRAAAGGTLSVFARLREAAEREVDELVELHTLPQLPEVIPFAAVAPEGGAK